MKRKSVPKTWLIFFVLIVILVIGAWIQSGIPSSDKIHGQALNSLKIAGSRDPRNQDFKLSGAGSSLELTDQLFGIKSVVVKAVTLASPGYVTIYTDDHGVPGTLLGVSSIVTGSKEGLKIPTSVTLESGQIYYAMLRKDNGDGKFDEMKDNPISDEKSTVILVNFIADLTKTAS